MDRLSGLTDQSNGFCGQGVAKRCSSSLMNISGCMKDW